MPDTDLSLDLSSLESDYTIVGELGSTADRRTLMAERKTADSKRREDHRGVIIAIHSTPEGDEANALSHLAADNKLLAAEGHRRLVPILDGRWMGDKHFAVIAQRIADPSVRQRLAGREVFSTVRIAAILREVNGLLEWARERGVVHRNITCEGVYLEPRTDRVRVMFDVTPLHRVRPAEETRDGRTIARLAMAMLAGVEDPDTCSVDTLHEMRPELPERLAAATAELLDVKNASTKTDIVNYIALIGMSDPLYRGEEEEKRIRNEILEEQRQEREKLANERAEFEAMIARERADFQALMERERAKLENDRHSLEKAVADERARLQKTMTQERADLTARRAELEKAVAAQKAELERVAALDRRKIEELRAELKRRGEAEIEAKRQVALEDVHDASETELDSEELAAPLFIGPNLIPIEPLTFEEENAVLATDPVVFPGPEEEPVEETPVLVGAGAAPDTPGERRPWVLPTAIGGGALVLGLAALLLVNHREPATPAAAPAPHPVVAQAPVAPAPAAVATAQPLVPLPPAGSVVVDSASGSIAPRVDSTGIHHGADLASSEKTDEQRKAEKAAREKAEARRQAARTQADSIFNFRRADSSGASPRRDSSAAAAPVKRDSIAPPDTIKP